MRLRWSDVIFFSPSIGCGSGRAAAVVRLWCSGDDVNGGIYARTAFSLAAAAAAATQAAQQQLLLLFRWRNLYLPPVFVFLCALHSSLRLDTHTHAQANTLAHTHTQLTLLTSLRWETCLFTQQTVALSLRLSLLFCGELPETLAQLAFTLSLLSLSLHLGVQHACAAGSSTGDVQEILC